jgi:D-3-phosphoglycerate dehydrogenase
MKVLANDGIDSSAVEALERAGFTVQTDKIEQEDLEDRINEFDVLLVRSATKVRQNLIDAGTNLKIIGRGGVGMDNIDVEYARGKGIKVINTPAASSVSVAELVFAHLFAICRFIPQNNRSMPTEGMQKFKELKKASGKGTELRGKTLGIIGCGKIGQETASIAIGCGMKVLLSATTIKTIEISPLIDASYMERLGIIKIQTVSKEELLENSDFVSLHIPAQDKPVIGASELAMMKKGAGLVNCARGGVVDEAALVSALQSGHIAYAGVDVYENEPPTNDAILKENNVSLTPHIGGATSEAQLRVGLELVSQIVKTLGQQNA